jgi:hypothetical protein
MNPSQMRETLHSPDDEATIKRWRNVACICYGIISLAVVATAGVQYFIDHRTGHEARIAGSSMPTSAGRLPASWDEGLSVSGSLGREERSHP